MKIIADTTIKHNGELFQAGQDFSASDKAAHQLIELGAAHKATTKPAPQPEAPTAAAPATTVAVSKDMKRDELDTIAESEGLTDLEQYETKADLVEAISNNRNSVTLDIHDADLGVESPQVGGESNG